MRLQERNMQKQIAEISGDLQRILDEDTDESVMLFTDDKEIAHLLEQINRVLDERKKVKAEYRKTENAAKKMLANISHDIKTPLTVIIGYLEIMLLHHQYDEKMMTKISDKAHQLMDLVDQFFTLVKLESGDTLLQMSVISLNEFCRESMLDFYDILTEQNFEVEIGIEEEQVYASVDKKALGRILSNLISNAIRYGRDGQYIGLTLRGDAHFAYIDITDHGKGIARDEAVHVFDRLYTLEDSRNRQIQGNGLGLTIAKDLAEKMDGTLELVSVPNEQTTFTLKLKRN